MSDNRTLEVKLRALRDSKYLEDGKKVSMAPLRSLGKGVFFGCPFPFPMHWKSVHIDTLLPDPLAYELDVAGFWIKSENYELLTVSFDRSQWWRVVPAFKSWSRKVMRPEANLLNLMPCELHWFSKDSRAYFIAVYSALCRALPWEVVDMLVLPCLGCNDIVH